MVCHWVLKEWSKYCTHFGLWVYNFHHLVKPSLNVGNSQTQNNSCNLATLKSPTQIYHSQNMFCWFCSRTSKEMIYAQQFWCVWVENGHIGRKYTDQRKFLTHPRVKQKCLLQFGRIANQLSREIWLVRFFKTYSIYSTLHENMIF